MPWQLPLYDDGIATLHFYSGAWDDAVAELETCIALAKETGTLWWLVPANCALAYINIHRDQIELAGAAVSTAGRRVAAAGDFGANRLNWVNGLLHEARGDLPKAHTLIEEGWAMTSAAGFLPHLLIMGPDLVRVALAVGAKQRASEVAGIVEEIANRTGVASWMARGQLCRGMVDRDATGLQKAVATLRRSPRRVDLAFACEEAGTCLSTQGQAADGIALLDEALEGYRRLGAQRDARRVVAFLRSLGARRPRPERRRRPVLGWEALTGTELKVVELTCWGLANPEIGSRLFISRRTVATHLSHIFSKLQISSRAELTRLAEERGPGGQSGPHAEV